MPSAQDAPITDLFAVRDGIAPAVMAPAGVAADSGAAVRGFGGHVAALALAAAYESVHLDLSVHHVHVEFLRPAAAGRPLRLGVRSYRDGRSVARRFVEASQEGEPPCAIMTATFHLRDPRGPDHQRAMPPAPPVLDAPLTRTVPVETRRMDGADDPSSAQVWIRPHVRPIAAAPRLHDCALLFLSDFTVSWTILTVHGIDPERDRHTVLGSVAHTMWFHRRGRADEWLLYDQRTPSTSDGFGHAEGRLFTQSGLLLASVAQVGILRAPGSQAGPARAR
jgi:acyl-CoA thioesterase II